MHFASIAARRQPHEWLLHFNQSPTIWVWPGSLNQKVSLENTFLCRWQAVVVQSPPRRLTFSLPFCVHRILPFSQCSRPSLSDLEWPLLTLSSSHLGGGWQIRPSGLLITTVSLWLTRIPLDTRNSKEMGHWRQWPGCSWTPWCALSLESSLSGHSGFKRLQPHSISRGIRELIPVSLARKRDRRVGSLWSEKVHFRFL